MCKFLAGIFNNFVMG